MSNRGTIDKKAVLVGMVKDGIIIYYNGTKCLYPPILFENKTVDEIKEWFIGQFDDNKNAENSCERGE